MSHKLRKLYAASSENFSHTSQRVKNLIPVCKAAKNKKLLRLLQQRITGNKSANFLGTKIQVYHRIAKRKKFNKLAVSLMNTELYNSIRDLGCHTWVTGIQYGMIRELRRIHGRRILSSRCLENLEDVPTEILLCMIWRQLQLIPVTRKASEEKLQQIVRCYMSLIWAVSIRKGLQTIKKLQQKKQENETDEKFEKHSGSVNWKWRILQQSNKLLSKFLLKPKISKNLKLSASQPSIHLTEPSSEGSIPESKSSRILQMESTLINAGRKSTDIIDRESFHNYGEVINEMKSKHASKQSHLEEKEQDLDISEIKDAVPWSNGSEDRIYRAQNKIGEPPSQNCSEQGNESLQLPNNSKCNLEEQNTLKIETQYFDSYLRSRNQTNRDKSDLYQFTLPPHRSHDKKKTQSNLQVEGKENMTRDILTSSTKDSCSEKLSKYMGELNSSNPMISQEAREYCKRLLLSNFEESLPRIKAMHVEKKLISSLQGGVMNVKTTDCTNRCNAETPPPEFFPQQELVPFEGSQFYTELSRSHFGPAEKLTELINESIVKRSDMTSSSQNFSKIMETQVNSSDNFPAQSKKNDLGDSFTLENKINYETPLTEKPETERKHLESYTIAHRKSTTLDGFKKTKKNRKEEQGDQETKSFIDKDADYETTLKNLQRTISVHDAELKKLRFLNYVIDTNWRYFSAKHNNNNNNAKIILNSDPDRLELCQEDFSGLSMDRIRSEIWRKILHEEEKLLTNTPCKASKPLNIKKSDVKESKKSMDEKKTDFCCVEDSIQDFQDLFQKLKLRDGLKVDSHGKNKPGVNKTLGVGKSNDEEGSTRKDFKNPAEVSKKTKNILLKKTSNEISMVQTQNNISRYYKKLINLKQKFKALKLQRLMFEQKNVIEIDKFKIKQLVRNSQNHRSFRRKLLKEQEKFPQKLKLQINRITEMLKKELIQAPKNDGLVTKKMSTQNDKIFGSETNKKFQLQKENGLENKKKNLVNKNQMLKEKVTKIIYNNSNFDTKQSNSCKIQPARLKNVTNVGRDIKMPKTEGLNLVQSLLEIEDADHKDLKDKITEAEQVNELMVPVNDLQIEKYLRVQNVNLEKNKQVELCRLMLEKKKQLKKHLKLVNDFLMQLVESTTSATKKKIPKENLEVRTIPEIEGHSNEDQPNLHRNSSKLETCLSKSETVNAKYYIENQTVIAHPRNTRKRAKHVNKYECINRQSLPLLIHGTDSTLIRKKEAACYTPKVTTKKTDSYRLLILIVCAFLLYHSVSLITLLQRESQTYVKDLRYEWS